MPSAMVPVTPVKGSVVEELITVELMVPSTKPLFLARLKRVTPISALLSEKVKPMLLPVPDLPVTVTGTPPENSWSRVPLLLSR